MTKKEALAEWRDYVLPWIVSEYEKDGKPDIDARAESWNNFTDALCKDGQITLSQYEGWTNPF